MRFIEQPLPIVFNYCPLKCKMFFPISPRD